MWSATNSSVDESLAPLRFADDDAARYFELLEPGAAQAHLLTTFDSETQSQFPELVDRALPPTRENLQNSLQELAERIDDSHRAGNDTVLYVVFSGHGGIGDNGEGFLSLLDGPWTQDDMVEFVIAPELADFTHLVIDACNAFYMVQDRGWQDDAMISDEVSDAVDEYLMGVDVLDRYPTVGVMLSTAGAAEVFEWGPLSFRRLQPPAAFGARRFGGCRWRRLAVLRRN